MALLRQYSAKTQNCQINVTGWRQVLNHFNWKVWVDESIRSVKIGCSRSNITIPQGNSFEYAEAVIPTEYRPKYYIIFPAMRNQHIRAYVMDSGIIGINNSNSSAFTNYDLFFEFNYHY